MLDLALVPRALAGPGQDSAEGAIEEILRLVQAVEHKAAAARAAGELKAGSTDIRVIVAFLLGAFEERGPAALPGLMDTLSAAVASRWDAIRPEARRPRVVDSAVSLLFRSIKASLDFHEKVRDAIWRAWAERITPELAAACLAASSTLDAAFAPRIPGSTSAVELAGVRSRAQLILQKLPPPPAPQPEPPPTPATPPADADPIREEINMDQPGSTLSGGGAGPDPVEPAPGVRMMEVSPALDQFIRKIEVFALLIERGETGKAAIVAQDIRGAVERFDPRVYLPRLLTPHFRLLSAHIEDIAGHWEKAGSPAWQAMEQLYQVDLDAFLEP